MAQRIGVCGEVTLLLPRKTEELELKFEIPTWNSNWDFEELTVKFTVRFTINSVIYNITPKI